MDLDIREEPIKDALTEHASISIAFRVESVLELDVVNGGLGGIRLVERPVETPWIKDYDGERDEGPTRWARLFDLTNWGLLSAWTGGQRVGGAAIAFDTPGVSMLRNRRELAVLWDIRVRPEFRGSGAGSALFSSVERWASSRGCGRLEVETQNINVPACRFYARQGCELGMIDRLAYEDLPGEIELLWYKSITPGRGDSPRDGRRP
jgi:GNAT superfamily N-acetyltransferase